MIIETSTLKYEATSIEDLKKNTNRTPISDQLAKRYKLKPSDCAMWNGNLFVYNQKKDTVWVIDYFTKERVEYTF